MENNVNINADSTDNKEEVKMTYKFTVKGYCKDGEGCYEIRTSSGYYTPQSGLSFEPVVSHPVKNTTHNRMELNAAIVALSRTPENSNVEIMSTSQYLVNGLTQKHDKNIDLWDELESLANTRNVSFIYVKDVVAETLTTEYKEAVKMNTDNDTIIANEEEFAMTAATTDTAVNDTVNVNNEEVTAMETGNMIVVESETTNVKAVKLYYDAKIGEAKLDHKKSKDALGDIRIEGKTKIDKLNAAKEAVADKSEKKVIAKSLRLFRAELAVKKDEQQLVVLQKKLALDSLKLAKIRAVIAAESGISVKIEVEIPVAVETNTSSISTVNDAQDSASEAEDNASESEEQISATDSLPETIEPTEEVATSDPTQTDVVGDETSEQTNEEPSEVETLAKRIKVSDIHSPESTQAAIKEVANPAKDVILIDAKAEDLLQVVYFFFAVNKATSVANCEITWDSEPENLSAVCTYFASVNASVKNIVKAETPCVEKTSQSASDVETADSVEGSELSKEHTIFDDSEYNPSGTVINI